LDEVSTVTQSRRVNRGNLNYEEYRKCETDPTLPRYGALHKKWQI